MSKKQLYNDYVKQALGNDPVKIQKFMKHVMLTYGKEWFLNLEGYSKSFALNNIKNVEKHL